MYIVYIKPLFVCTCFLFILLIILIIDGDEAEFEEDEEEVIIEEEGLTRRKHRRKTLTYQQQVNSIDSALDETNYDPVPVPETVINITGYLPDPDDKKKKKEIKFVNQEPPVVGRQKASDVIRNKPGLSSYSKEAVTVKDVWDLFHHGRNGFIHCKFY